MAKSHKAQLEDFVTYVRKEHTGSRWSVADLEKSECKEALDIETGVDKVLAELADWFDLEVQ